MPGIVGVWRAEEGIERRRGRRGVEHVHARRGDVVGGLLPRRIRVGVERQHLLLEGDDVLLLTAQVFNRLEERFHHLVIEDSINATA